ncbi:MULTISPECIES: cytochrome bc1 complex Rieske iron-sulfur subunit [Actinokineospora]|uniref:Cytochrome bc1 complex Rieske iron-sulfur subunit n=1 Tax=Actinokineospora fastidiosa TaxID=1816 RepID=A0A918LEY4_9PSEU|nr:MULTISPECIES: ubiquinol-cytochrome c reductase iron-sulfur subunit [Actinokineospora]UVS77849.1 Arsenite oxidase subunit AioB precursor [Actinokineospora sp. UTMC 2448]GGS40573.1 ubiquinol-cytochrome c reductase iron-sulfur subunit [Actinokineospora fastidiosa]
MSAKNPDELPSEADLAEMSRDDLVRLGAKLDGVELVEYPDPWPVKGTRAEKRAERLVALWFGIAALAGLAFVAVYLFWPAEYAAYNEPGHTMYLLYTPMLGATLGLCILGIGVGVLMYTKKFIPHELAVQQRHDGGSSELDKATIVAELADAGNRSTITRRPMIKATLGAGAGVMGLGLGVFAIGGLVRDPWADSDGKESLWHTGWQETNGERVYLRRATGNPHEVVLVQPGDLDAGAMETVFPFRESERDDHHALSMALKRSDNPVMLIRLRPEDAAKVVKHKGQEDFNYGDFYAYSKICSHLGCPTSLYEQRTNRILCPCHQSQFDALQYAKPIFGPATRKLAQLPIALDEETGYLYAKSDFIEPIGPAFWERKS